MKRTMLSMAILLAISLMTLTAQALPEPTDFFGFKPGSDRNLFSYEQLVEYLQQLDEGSDRIRMDRIGQSPMGRPMYAVFISSPANIARLDEMKKVNRELALNPKIPEAELEKMLNQNRVFVMATLSMHSTEVAPSQSAPLIAYELATTNDPEKLGWLDQVVYMMVPCHNPDGMDMVVENYLKHKGTTYEGASLPRVYHKYVGHDNNRDFVILSQEDTKAVARLYNLDWHPQVMVEKHQMGSTGIRYFVPPNHDPIAVNVPAGVFHWAGVFGQHMATDMTADGCKGVAQHTLFDDYWPGSTETCIWKNVIGFLTEAASAKTASPIYVEPTELSVGGKGLSEYKKGINMLDPWEGGWWRLGDIVDYELSSTWSILKTASLYRSDILAFRNRMCREQVTLGKTEAPFYYILPQKQHDQGELVDLVRLMQEHGIETYTLEKELVLKGRIYRKGDVVIPLSQAFRPFIKEVMEAQEYPERHYTPGGELIRPYDIASWSLPLHRGLCSYEINTRSQELETSLRRIDTSYDLKTEKAAAAAVVLPVNSNASYRAAFHALSAGMKVQRLAEVLEQDKQQLGKGSFVIYQGKNKEAWDKMLKELPFEPMDYADRHGLPVMPMEMPRIALVETHFHDMDAGWTRFVLDSYHLPYTVLHPAQIKETELHANYDVLIFPNNNKDVLMDGKSKTGTRYQASYHPDYLKGITKEGMEKIMDFSHKGGIVIAWGASTALFEGTLKFKQGKEEEEFGLPFRDLSADLSKKGLYIAGSLVNVQLKQDHPLTRGMPERIGVFSRGRPVFQTSLPGFDMDRRVIATYPEKDILLSGYAAEEKLMGNQVAMIWMRKGKGQFVFFGFGPQFRASTQASYKLLFNAILLEPIP